jgi:hypothetical protein
VAARGERRHRSIKIERGATEHAPASEVGGDNIAATRADTTGSQCVGLIYNGSVAWGDGGKSRRTPRPCRRRASTTNASICGLLAIFGVGALTDVALATFHVD